MARKDSQIDKLGAVLEKSLQRLELSGRLVEYGVWPIWDDIVGPTIARNAQPEKIRHGTLFVKVSGPTWMQQLQYMKEMISERLNQKLGQEVVKNIFFVVGKIEKIVPETKTRKPPVPSSPPSETRPDEDQLLAVKDPELRRALKRLLSAAARKGKG
jgi:predicted nucleic acid-binding Zn ribbon protein